MARIRKTQSEPRRASSNEPGLRPAVECKAVLLTKKDFENLRTHALSPSRQLPRCLPVSSVTVSTKTAAESVQKQPLPSAAVSGNAAPRRMTPKMERKVRPPSHQAPPSPSHQERVSCGSSGSRNKNLDKSPMPMLSVAPKPVKNGVGPILGIANNTSNQSGGTGTNAASRLRVSCSSDARRPPRPDQLNLRSSSQEPSEVPDRERNVMLSLGGLGLQVSGQAALVVVQAPTVAGAETLDANVNGGSEVKLEVLEDLISSDEESHAEDIDADFDYREYRYERCQEAKARAAPPEPQRRGGKPRRAFMPKNNDHLGEDDYDGDFSPWIDNQTQALQGQFGAASLPSGMQQIEVPLSRSSTPFCEDESGNEVRRVGDVLFKFYGLPDTMDRSVRFRYNAAIITDEAWAKKTRQSQIEEPPMMWVRGGRVYDFHGDRGTVAEFSNDLLGRQVEDDAICRQRRRDQGLLPFPFLALPIKRNEDPEEAEAGADVVIAGPCTRNPGSDGRDARRRPPMPFK